MSCMWNSWHRSFSQTVFITSSHIITRHFHSLYLHALAHCVYNVKNLNLQKQNKVKNAKGKQKFFGSYFPDNFCNHYFLLCFITCKFTDIFHSVGGKFVGESAFFNEDWVYLSTGFFDQLNFIKTWKNTCFSVIKHFFFVGKKSVVENSNVRTCFTYCCLPAVRVRMIVHQASHNIVSTCKFTS